MASLHGPTPPARPRIAPPAVSGQTSGKADAGRSRPQQPPAPGQWFAYAWLRCTTVQLTAAAGTPSATNEPIQALELVASPIWPANIQAMPSARYNMIATQVRAGSRRPVTTRASSAVSKGPSAMVTSTRATPVMVRAPP